MYKTATMTEAVLPPDNLLPPTTPQSTVASMTLEQLMNAVGTRVQLEMQAQSSRRHGRHRTYNGVIQHPLQVIPGLCGGVLAWLSSVLGRAGQHGTF